MLLTFDPGITTGWALLSDTGELVDCGVLTLEGAQAPDQVEKTYDITTVIIEDVPIPTNSEMNRQLLDLTVLLKVRYPNAVLVRPGVWKTTPARFASLPEEWNERKLTTHEKDAIHIGLWYVMSQGVST